MLLDGLQSMPDNLTEMHAALIIDGVRQLPKKASLTFIFTERLKYYYLNGTVVLSCRAAILFKAKMAVRSEYGNLLFDVAPLKK